MQVETDIVLALDVGEKRVGVARADSAIKLSYPLCTITVDGTEYDQIERLMRTHQATKLIVGYPRNQAGEETAQTAYVEKFAQGLQQRGVTVSFQDESLTSIVAEDRLKQSKKPYDKADIDAEAAAIILQDYMEITYGH